MDVTPLMKFLMKFRDIPIINYGLHIRFCKSMVIINYWRGKLIMRTARIIGNGASYYHCMSRIIQGQMLLNDSEKERFRKIVRAVGAFAGVEVMTYALMTNHLHLLLMVPEKCEIDEKEVLRRINGLYGRVR